MSERYFYDRDRALLYIVVEETGEVRSLEEYGRFEFRAYSDMPPKSTIDPESPQGPREQTQEENTGNASSGKKKKVTCSICGMEGHNKKSCPTPEDNHDENFEITEDVVAEVSALMEEGWGAQEISRDFNISIKKANEAIAYVKGITL